MKLERDKDGFYVSSSRVIQWEEQGATGLRTEQDFKGLNSPVNKQRQNEGGWQWNPYRVKAKSPKRHITQKTIVTGTNQHSHGTVSEGTWQQLVLNDIKELLLMFYIVAHFLLKYNPYPLLTSKRNNLKH